MQHPGKGLMDPEAAVDLLCQQMKITFKKHHKIDLSCPACYHLVSYYFIYFAH